MVTGCCGSSANDRCRSAAAVPRVRVAAYQKQGTPSSANGTRRAASPEGSAGSPGFPSPCSFTSGRRQRPHRWRRPEDARILVGHLAGPRHLYLEASPSRGIGPISPGVVGPFRRHAAQRASRQVRGVLGHLLMRREVRAHPSDRCSRCSLSSVTSRSRHGAERERCARRGSRARSGRGGTVVPVRLGIDPCSVIFQCSRSRGSPVGAGGCAGARRADKRASLAAPCNGCEPGKLRGHGRQ